MDRGSIYRKTAGRCAYCGVDLSGRRWHIDHVIPLYRGNGGVMGGADNADNALPACPRCNRRKSVLGIEDFRREIEMQVSRLRRDSASFRLAEDFGLVGIIKTKIVFYFEMEDSPASPGTEVNDGMATD